MFLCEGLIFRSSKMLLAIRLTESLRNVPMGIRCMVTGKLVLVLFLHTPFWLCVES